MSKSREVIFRWPAKEKKSFAKIMLTVGAVTLTLYTLTALLLAWLAGEQPNDALTYSVFAYWGIEGGWTALLKINERKSANEDKPTDEKGDEHP